MWKKYRDRGLVVVGVTNEPKSLVEKAIKKKHMKFPVAMVKTNEEQPFAVRGFPTSFLVDVDGTILWKGHPAAFDSQFGTKRLETYLAKTVSLPSLPDDYVKSVAKHIEKRAYGKAHGAILKAMVRDADNESLKTYVEKIESIVEFKIANAEELLDEGEYGRAMAVYEQLLGQFSGVPGAEGAKELAANLKANKEARDELAATAKWESAMKDWRKGKFDKALSGVRSIAKKYGSTPTGQRADEMVYRHDS